jgi:hypothetical protein
MILGNSKSSAKQRRYLQYFEERGGDSGSRYEENLVVDS